MKSWEKVKKDLQKEIKAGVSMVKEGAAVVKKKAEQLTVEGKKQYKIYELKSKVQEWISELGGKVYALNTKVSNPMTDTTVRLMIARIKKLESQIAKLEGKPKSAPKKAPAKPSAQSAKSKMPAKKLRKSS